MERYRSGHNEAVLKTVCPKGREGSNPSLSADFSINKENNHRKQNAEEKSKLSSDKA